MPGGFNEQALSNVVYAYEKAGMLDRELLQWVFSVASLRLDRRDAPPSFKPQASAGARVRRGDNPSTALSALQVAPTPFWQSGACTGRRQLWAFY